MVCVNHTFTIAVGIYIMCIYHTCTIAVGMRTPPDPPSVITHCPSLSVTSMGLLMDIGILPGYIKLALMSGTGVVGVVFLQKSTSALLKMIPVSSPFTPQPNLENTGFLCQYIFMAKPLFSDQDFFMARSLHMIPYPQFWCK